MKAYLKFSLVMGLSMILVGCQPSKKKATPFPATKNELVVSPEPPAETGEDAEAISGETYSVAYHLRDAQQELVLFEERYASGQLVLEQQPLLEMTQVDIKGYITVQLEALGKPTEGKETRYQLCLKVNGTQANHGEARWQVSGLEASHPLVSTAVTLPEAPLDATEEHILFGVKLSPAAKATPLTADFLNEPQSHLDEVGDNEIVYIFRCHFKAK